MRKVWRYFGIAAALLLVGALLYGPVQTWQEVRRAEQRVHAGSPSQRRSALRDLAHYRTRRADGSLHAALAAPDAATRNDAVYAIGTGHRADMAPDLLLAWSREPDSQTRSSMVYYWAQLVGPAAEATLQPLLASKDPWTALGAAKGLLRLGHLEAARQVLEVAGGPDTELAVEARKELQSLVGPLAGMIGQKAEIADLRPAEWSPQQVSALDTWWQTHVTPRLLRDYLAWRNEKPDPWQMANLLLHEWKGRFSGFLRLSTPPQSRG
jgi:hypothetical protein